MSSTWCVVNYQNITTENMPTELLN